jgi:hypothetical protein
LTAAAPVSGVISPMVMSLALLPLVPPAPPAAPVVALDPELFACDELLQAVPMSPSDKPTDTAVITVRDRGSDTRCVRLAFHM